MSLLVRLSTLSRHCQSDKCLGFLYSQWFIHTIWYSNTMQSSADSRVVALDPSDGKSPDNAKTQLTANDLEIFRLHKEACEVRIGKCISLLYKHTVYVRATMQEISWCYIVIESGRHWGYTDDDRGSLKHSLSFIRCSYGTLPTSHSVLYTKIV